ncbi:MAG: hypothetical protein N2747_00090 [Chitinophagaceae bacterium]|nr:hypothetical protein [Chitinophagaceae bacterium]
MSFLLFEAAFIKLYAQDEKLLLQKVKEKYDKVNDYVAEGKLKTNVIFIKAPVSNVKVYYKKPDKMKIKNEKGVSFIPKGVVNININEVLSLQHYEAISSGTSRIGNTECRVIKIFPLRDEENITRATLYVDENRHVILKSVISTREEGTYELLMSYNRYVTYGLPDKVQLSFNTREYKLPKGITMDYDNGAKTPDPKNMQNRKGKVEITYSGYVINQGVSDNVFQ